MCMLELEPCSVFEDRPRMARKEHRCDGCGARIRKGEAYTSHFQVFEGTPRREAMCFGCFCARKQFGDEHGTLFAPAELIPILRECIDEKRDKSDPWRSVLAGVLRRVHTAHWQDRE